jgi:AraC family transcriptional regulator of adaptative response/methylated-DNA-[protein]-cysteine methyltransferase
VLARDASYDGQFVFSVSSTGVYCRPSCPAREPRPENVRFHLDGQAARHAGFRACLRCQPDAPSLAQRHRDLVADACAFIEQATARPSLDELAERAGVSRFHFHRVFKSTLGVTPMAYANAHRARRLRGELAGGGTVTEAMLDAGFNSSARFYAQSGRVLGMTPSAYRAGGRDACIRFAVGECSLGAILVAASDVGTCAIALGDEPESLVRELQDRFPQARLAGADADFEAHVAQVVALVENPSIGTQLPLDVRGTAFQQRVWQALREIPPGQTLSYAAVAERIGAPAAVRAVAGACAANTLAVAIPCHRVVRTDGALSGYRWGIERKRELLEREANA